LLKEQTETKKRKYSKNSTNQITNKNKKNNKGVQVEIFSGDGLLQPQSNNPFSPIGTKQSIEESKQSSKKFSKRGFNAIADAGKVKKNQSFIIPEK